ncbi:hypothetical protein JI739_10855 [Ramlibacter sp. AW1]|uniref:Uncharacterized protein n=1 Tax=Ramlibacter aurantiacus TaxID=2801330 RepID=A0A937D1S8_9BURK|nr:hypothetical protein [Ramlibacter aurantiacus]MBL0420844.1 hypothetical protein [Ramlibacter aurantiacus]
MPPGYLKSTTSSLAKTRTAPPIDTAATQRKLADAARLRSEQGSGRATRAAEYNSKVKEQSEKTLRARDAQALPPSQGHAKSSPHRQPVRQSTSARSPDSKRAAGSPQPKPARHRPEQPATVSLSSSAEPQPIARPTSQASAAGASSAAAAPQQKASDVAHGAGEARMRPERKNVRQTVTVHAVSRPLKAFERAAAVERAAALSVERLDVPSPDSHAAAVHPLPATETERPSHPVRESQHAERSSSAATPSSSRLKTPDEPWSEEAHRTTLKELARTGRWSEALSCLVVGLPPQHQDDEFFSRALTVCFAVAQDKIQAFAAAVLDHATLTQDQKQELLTALGHALDGPEMKEESRRQVKGAIDKTAAAVRPAYFSAFEKARQWYRWEPEKAAAPPERKYS